MSRPGREAWFALLQGFLLLESQGWKELLTVGACVSHPIFALVLSNLEIKLISRLCLHWESSPRFKALKGPFVLTRWYRGNRILDAQHHVTVGIDNMADLEADCIG